MRTRILGFTVVLGLTLGVRAEANLITFDEVVPTEVIQTSLDSGGFRFASGHFHTYGCLCRIWAGIASNGTPHIGYESGRGLPIVMTRNDGGLFSLFSMDVAEFYAAAPSDRPNADLLTITGSTVSGAIVSHSLYLDGFVDGLGGGIDFEHFALPNIFTNLTSVTFTGLRFDGSDGGVTMDNIEYSSVPEPSSLALLGLGLVGFGTTRRKRRGPHA